MKTRLLLLVLLLSGATLFGQNLVINPSFENTSSNCGNLGGEGFGTDLLDWDNANSNAPGDSCSSPDLFSACNTIPFFGGPGPTHMPNSLLGFQRSRTGTRHAGIITYAPGIAAGCTPVGNDQYREYIQGHTTTPLAAGQTYCVSMYVSLGDNVVWSTNNMGIRFTNTQYLRDACANGNNSLINLTPQLNYNCAATITDTVNWVRIQWNYTAVGGEQWFTIGNFFNNAGTTRACSNSGASLNPYAYYYIDDVSITPNTCCAATINPHAPVCPTDAAFNLIATPPLGTNCSPTVSGTWSGTGITNANLGTFNPATAGVGTHTITYTLSCGGTVTTTITVSPCATLTLCMEQNGNLTVSGGAGPYQWQTPSTQQDCSGCPLGMCFPPICNGTTVTVWTTFTTGTSATPPGTFPFRVRDVNNNIITVTTLSGIPGCACTLSASTSNTPATCGNANGSASVTNVTGGGGSPTYLWGNGSTGSSLNNIPGGTYVVTINDGNCSTQVSITVPSTPGITLSPSSTATTCGNANGSAGVTATGGNGQFNYSWSNGGSGSSITGVAGGTYSVTVTGGGCTATQSITIGSSTAVTLSATGVNTTCGNNNGSATTTILTGAGPFSYSWTNGGGTGPGLTNVGPGTYTVTATGLGGCTGTQTVTIGASTAVTLTPSSTNANCNQANGTASVVATGGNGNYSYSWSNGGSGSSITAATGTYTVTVTSGTCTSTQTITIGQNTSMSSTVTGTGTTCAAPNSGTVALTVTGGTPTYDYLWSNGTTTEDLSGVPAGEYIVTITDDAGCVITDTFEVAAPDMPVATAVPSDETCKGLEDGEINLTVTGGTPSYTYLWSNGETTEDIEDLSPGNYTVTITDNAGCVVTTQAITVALGPDYPLAISQDGDTLTCTSAPNYQWYKDGVQIGGANSQTYIMTGPGAYFCTTSIGLCKYASNVLTITSITEQTNFADVQVYPNPATDMINVVITLKTPQKVTLNLYDVLGRNVAQNAVDYKAATYQVTLPLKGVSAGMYFLNIASETESKGFKVVVKQ